MYDKLLSLLWLKGACMRRNKGSSLHVICDQSLIRHEKACTTRAIFRVIYLLYGTQKELIYTV